MDLRPVIRILPPNQGFDFNLGNIFKGIGDFFKNLLPKPGITYDSPVAGVERLPNGEYIPGAGYRNNYSRVGWRDAIDINHDGVIDSSDKEPSNHKGTDIAMSADKPIGAAHGGKVIRVGEDDRGGGSFVSV